MARDTITIPKKPFLFGFFITRFHLRWAVFAVIAVLIGTGLDRFTVVILRNLTDSLSAQIVDITNVWKWAITFPLILFVSQNIWRISGFTGMRWFMNFRSTAYNNLYGHLSHHSKDYFNNRFAGSLANKMSNAVDGTQDLFEQILWRFMPLAVGLIWYIIFAWNSEFRLGLIITIWSTVFLSMNIWFAKKMQPYSYRFAESMSNMKGTFVDSISNISLVHEYAHIAGEKKYISKYINKQFDAGILRWRIGEWVLAVNGVLIFIFMISMLTTSVYLFQNQIITIGVVIMVVFIISDLGNQLFFIGKEIRDAARYYGEAKEGLEEILSEHVVSDSVDATSLIADRGEIIVDSINFEYENTQVFSNFSLSISPGQKVGLVGRSGAGKSTFVSLLLRHYDVQKGVISIDGQNIKNITLESLRKAIAFVPQDTSLFHRTIMENIRYSRPGASDEEVKEAARLAQAHEFIESLPEGYATMVGERGVKLSGGQRQRVAIARAFLKDAPILILDEATSSLDSESEQAIQHSLEKLMRGRTVIAIAHRLSTLKKMDRIIIIDSGRIVEDGNPEELLKKDAGIFKDMWNHQVSGFITDD